MPAVKREDADSESEDESARRSEPSTPPKRAKSKGGRPKSSPAKSSPSRISDGEKKMGAWSGEELKLLYAIMCPKRVSRRPGGRKRGQVGLTDADRGQLGRSRGSDTGTRCQVVH